MDSHTRNAVSGAVDLAKQNTLSAIAGQTDNLTKNTASTPGSAVTDHNNANHKRKVAKAAKATLHNAKQSHDSSKLARRKTRYAEHQFPFLRFPAEVRLNVYKLALATVGRCKLSNFKLPPLLEVSEQVRSEAAGLLTAINGILLSVRSNYVLLADDHQTPLVPPVFYDDIGLPQLDGAATEWLKDKKTFFSDVIIDVQTVSAEKFQVGAFFIGGQVNRYKPEVKFLVSYRKNLGPLERMFTDIAADITKVLKEAGARPNSAGLNYSDLKKIAKFFDYVKPE